MSYIDHQRAMVDLACRLADGITLSDEERRFLATGLYRIGTGEDANKVLRVTPQRGEKLSDVIARRRMSMILHWIAGRLQPDPESGPRDTSVESACIEALDTIVPAAKVAFPGADDRMYDADYLLRCWNEPAYRHMRSPDRQWYDPDFPYWPLPPVKDSK